MPARDFLRVACLLVLAAAGCAPEPTPPPLRDVLLITVDTARADRFGFVAGKSGDASLTPRADALAREGVGFAQAISPAPLTLPAHASLFTGRQPPSHGVRDNGAYRLPDAETTLAELLRKAGFRTGAFVGARVLAARYGLDQGFDLYDDAIPEAPDSPFLFYAERPGEQVVRAALDWADGRDEAPVFAWVHLFEPHAPYRPPEPERSRHGSAYDGEIAYADRLVGGLLDGWDARRGLDRTLVVLTADHGEALGENGEASHGVLVHDATLRVPLAIRAPGLRRAETVDDPVHLIDVLPTVVGLLGIAPSPGVQGRDLGPLLRGGTLPWRSESGYAESLYAALHHACAPLTALREDGLKLVRPRGLAEELYDLAADPGETRDIAGERPDRRADLSENLDDLTAGWLPQDAAAAGLPPDAASRRELAALGYAWSAGPEGTDPATAPRHPREALERMRAMAAADRLVAAGATGAAGDVQAAVAAYRELIAAEPRGIDARVRLSHLLATRGAGAEAVELLRQALELAPSEPALHEQLAWVLAGFGRFDEALRAYEAGLRLQPDSREMRNGRWRCLNQLGRQPQLLAEANAAVAADPTDGMARYVRAIACCGAPLEAYVEALRREARQLPGDPVLERALAEALAER